MPTPIQPRANVFLLTINITGPPVPASSTLIVLITAQGVDSRSNIIHFIFVSLEHYFSVTNSFSRFMKIESTSERALAVMTMMNVLSILSTIAANTLCR